VAEPALVALSLGGNVGDVQAHFRHALARLSQTPGVELVAQSDVYRTAPWGLTDQAAFLNMAALLRVSMPARALLDLCLAIERERERRRDLRWGPRTLDLDVLTYGGQTIQEPGLTIPHPSLAERAFVLVPLADVAPDLEIGGARVQDLLAAVDAASVERLGPL
jgi:2-amino-4-hydroxy-6-hydroxymethyldihydropteridine diphosphokinase